MSEMTLKEMKAFLIEYAEKTPKKLSYIVRKGFVSYFACTGGHRLYYKSGDLVEFYMLNDRYVRVAVNGNEKDFDKATSELSSLIVNRMISTGVNNLSSHLLE